MKNKILYVNRKEKPKDESKNKDCMYLNGLQFSFRNQEDTAVIDIDGAIGFDIQKWLEDEEQNTGQNIKEKLRDIEASEIIVNINSLGGIVNDGLMIHDLLQEHESDVTTVVRGMTASAGTIVSQGGYRKISSNSRLLVHKAMAGMLGWFNTNDLETVIQDLDGLNETVSGVYETMGNKSASEYLDLMNENNGRGRWLSADEAKDWGLVDEVYEPSDSENTMNVKATDFKAAGMPVPEDIEDGESISVPVNVKLMVNGEKYDGSIEDLKNEFKGVTQPEKENDSTESDDMVPEGAMLEKARNREAELLLT